MRCALCLQEAPLCKSHIIPEFCFAPFYDKEHRIIEVTDIAKGKVRRRQKGYWERLLCTDCENLLNGFERHARRVFVDPLPAHEAGSSRVRQFRRVDFNPFKLFLLSILWRASVTNLSFFEHVSLGPHEENIRQMILKREAGDAVDYPILIFALHFRGEPLPDLMFGPTYMRLEGLKCYRFLLTGFIVLFFVSSHLPSEKFMRMVLSPERPVTVFDGDLEEFRFLREAWNRASETTRDVQF